MIKVVTSGPEEAATLQGRTDSLDGIEREKPAPSSDVGEREATDYSSNIISILEKRREKATIQSSAEGMSQKIESWGDGAALVKPRAVPARQPSAEFLEVMRAHLFNPILNALQQVQPHVGSPNAAVYINQILHRIRQMEDQSPDDPLLRVLFALYDALAFNGQWVNYSASQYEAARAVLLSCSGHTDLHPKRVQDAITKLEDTGFDTIPFSLNEERDA